MDLIINISLLFNLLLNIITLILRVNDKGRVSFLGAKRKQPYLKKKFTKILWISKDMVHNYLTTVNHHLDYNNTNFMHKLIYNILQVVNS